MTMEQQIKTALARAGMSQAQVARAIGQTPQNLNYKIRRGTLTGPELEAIAAVIGAEYIHVFRFPDGLEI